jgi:hypothetical protein
MRSRVLLLAAQACLLGLCVSFLVVPASALFLARYGAEGLPFVYLAVAVLGVALSRGLRGLQARLSLTAVAVCCIGAYVVLVAAGWALLRFGDQTWVSAVLVGLFPLAIPVGFVLVGTQAGRLLDVRAMKRYFARIVAGFSLGFAVGGAGAAFLTGPLGGPWTFCSSTPWSAGPSWGRRWPRAGRSPRSWPGTPNPSSSIAT